jgi:hypothetical protein
VPAVFTDQRLGQAGFRRLKHFVGLNMGARMGARKIVAPFDRESTCRTPPGYRRGIPSRVDSRGSSVLALLLFLRKWHSGRPGTVAGANLARERSRSKPKICCGSGSSRFPRLPWSHLGVWPTP